MSDERYWRSRRCNEALVLVKNESPSELTSICTISPFRLREEWLNYLVKLDDSEREILAGHHCRLVCGVTRDSTIKIFCEEGDVEFLSCFNIIDVDTHERREYQIRAVYSIIRQESIEELRYSPESSSIDSLYKDIVIILNAEDRILSCRIPMHYILTLFIRSRLRGIREKLGSSDLSVANIRRTMWIYKIENGGGVKITSCFNRNNVCPYILLASRGEGGGPYLHLCLVSLNILEPDSSPLSIDSSGCFKLDGSGYSSEILESGIGFYPLRSSYIWIVSTRRVARRLTPDGDPDQEVDDLRMEDLTECSGSDFYMLESTRSEIRLRGKLACTNYNVEMLRILNLTFKHEGKDQLETREYVLRAVSSTVSPNGLFCFDFKLRACPHTLESERMTVLSLVFMPILETEVGGYSLAPSASQGEIGEASYLNYSFGKSDDQGPSLDRSHEFDSLSRRSGSLRITTLCAVPNYVLQLFGTSMDKELNENFPLIFCGLSNGEWRTYSIKSSSRSRRGEAQEKLNLGSEDIGFFVLKGVHRLAGDELSIDNQLGGQNLRVSSSCWSFDRNKSTSVLSVAASNNSGNVFMWCLERERGRLFSRITGTRKKECEAEDSGAEGQPGNGQTKSQANSDKEKRRRATSSKKLLGNKDILETMDKHLRRIDERLRKVKIQEEIISDAERLQEKVRKNREKTRPRRLTKEEAANFVPECQHRSVSPRKGCKSCNPSDPDEEKPFFFRSKYDNFDYRRYRSYYRNNDHEYLFQLNNYLNIECIYKSELHTEEEGNRKGPLPLEKIVNFDQMCSKWSTLLENDLQYDEILNER
ncbi:hypothetical protein OJ253_1160 [Cryptosporidium canis]|uniref:Uncharacterized protein n=1 Tax=Cryptosporidium canis TaxID=195482 RepID=A0A9D5DI75_9CRYT|nr:hypothetical protein OJ253_1160 [Cryptosporidium canis]